jgi:hypothetical protein
MQQSLNIEKDTEGLQVALRELFEESYLRDAIGMLIEDADIETADRAYEDLPVRTLSPGYYTRAEYLIDLGSAIDTGAQYSAAMMDRSDIRGLQALKRAKVLFENDHPPCPGCGVRQDNRFATQCRSCSTKFRKLGE